MLKSKEEAQQTPIRKSNAAEENTKKDYHNNTKRKMSFKEKREYEQLTERISQLEEEKNNIEGLLCSGTLSIEELTEKSKRLPLLKEELDELEFRWLELSELT